MIDDFAALAQQCAPGVPATVLHAVVRTESGFNPFAIGVVGGRLARQPRNSEEAIATAKALHAGGWNFSVGLGQVNKVNFARFGLDLARAFDGCANLKASAAILQECYQRAVTRFGAGDAARQASFSCYYSGNFRGGFVREANGSSYVQRVAANTPSIQPAATAPVAAIPVVPAGKPRPSQPAPSSSEPARIETSPVKEAPRPATPDSSRPHAPWDALRDF
ncbi:transglycosylase SLT domain-containing protein [Cupriavidus necator]